MRITHANPPIPLRHFDYSATADGYEPGDQIGYGATSDAAMVDLLEQQAQIDGVALALGVEIQRGEFVTTLQP